MNRKGDDKMFPNAQPTMPNQTPNQMFPASPQELMEMASRLMEMARAQLAGGYAHPQQPQEAQILNLGKARCPHCGEVKDINRHFGFRTIATGETRPQSWCKPCRSSPESHPTRNGL